MGFAVLDDVESYPVSGLKINLGLTFKKHDPDCHVSLLTGKK